MGGGVYDSTFWKREKKGSLVSGRRSMESLEGEFIKRKRKRRTGTLEVKKHITFLNIWQRGRPPD